MTDTTIDTPELSQPAEKGGWFKKLRKNLILQKKEVDSANEELHHVKEETVATNTNTPEVTKRLDKLDIKLVSIQKMFTGVSKSLNQIQTLQKTLVELERRRIESANLRDQEDSLRNKQGVERVKNTDSKTDSLGLNLGALAGLAAVAGFNKIREYVNKMLGKFRQQFSEWITGQVLSLRKQFDIFKNGLMRTFGGLHQRFEAWIKDRAIGNIKKPSLNTLDKNGRELSGGARQMRELYNEKQLREYQQQVSQAMKDSKLLQARRIVGSGVTKVVKFSKKTIEIVARITGLRKALQLLKGVGKFAGAVGKAILVALTFADAIIAAFHNYQNAKAEGKEVTFSDVIDKKVWKEFAASIAGLMASIGVGVGAATAGAALGTILGTVLPGIGNIVGAIIGLLGGLIVSWIAAGAADFLAREIVDYLAGDKSIDQIWQDIKANAEQFIKNNTLEKLKEKTESSYNAVKSFFGGDTNKKTVSVQNVAKPSPSSNKLVENISYSGDYIDDALKMIEKEEGLPKGGKAYPDPSSKDSSLVSIGYGHQITKTEYKSGVIQIGDKRIPLIGERGLDTKITKEEAIELLKQDLPKYIEPLRKSLGQAWDKLSAMQKATLISSAYNTGQGGIDYLNKQGLRDAIEAGDYTRAGKIIETKGYRKTAGGVSASLIQRRMREGEIFASTATVKPIELARSTPQKSLVTSPVVKPSQPSPPPVVVAQNINVTPEKKKSIQNGIPNPGYSPSSTENTSVFHDVT